MLAGRAKKKLQILAVWPLNSLIPLGEEENREQYPGWLDLVLHTPLLVRLSSPDCPDCGLKSGALIKRIGRWGATETIASGTYPPQV